MQSLPGFGLPLNFTPHEQYTSHQYDTKLKKAVQLIRPAKGKWGPVFPTSLDEVPRRVEYHLLTQL
jgi:hypothetical protein